MRPWLLLLALSACAPTRPDGDGRGGGSFDGVAYGWYFGNCWGECALRLDVAADGTFAARTTGSDGFEYLVADGASHADWLDALIDEAEVDRSALPEVVGCPDCADGGGEFLEFGDGGDPPRVDWEFGDVPQTLLALHAHVGRLWSDVASCATGAGAASYTRCERGDIAVGR